MLDAFTKMGMYDGSQYEAYKARYNAVCEAEFKRELDSGNVTQDDHDEFVRNYVNEEIVADLMSETMSSSELVEVFAGKLGKDDSNVIVSFLKKLLNGIKSVFNSKDEFPNKFSDIIGMFEGAVKRESAVNKDIASTKTQIYKEDFEIVSEYDAEYDNYGVKLYPKKELSSSEYDELEKELRTRVKNITGFFAMAYPTAGYIRVSSDSPLVTLDKNLLFDKTKSSNTEVTKKSFAGNKGYSDSFMNDTLESFGIKKMGDYIHVQRQVFKTLLEEKFFTNIESRSRTDTNKESGMVIETNKSGIDETFSHNNYARLGKFKKIYKLATIRMLPEIIQNGKLIEDNVANKYNNGINKTFAYIEHKVNVKGDDIVVKLAIKKSPQKNKFWVHSIYEIENVNGSPASTTNGTEAGHITADIENSISQSDEKVNTKSALSSKSTKTDQTTTQNFKNWFGDWQNNPEKASKIVNADGTPMIMYHGSPEQFTAFDKSKAKASGAYGRGFYFTNSDSHAKQYGNLYAVYLDVKNPLKQGETKVTEDQIRNFLEAVAQNEDDYSIENYCTYDVSEIMKKIESRDAFSVIQDVNATAIGDMVAAAKLWNEVNGTSFDGIVVPTETVVFEPTQIKSATDNIGTFDRNDPDMRYSLTDTGVYSLEDAWAEKVKKYGAIPKGEKAARDVKVPKKISDNKYVSRTARSAIEAGITPAEFVPELQKEILDGKFTYERFPDDKAEAKAKETIEYHGFEGALEHWEFLMHSDGAISKENFSLGIALYNQCAQNGDFARAEKILADLSVEATRAGQAIQSMRLLKKMSADGTMYYLEKSIDKINDELVEKFGEKRAKKVKINEELARKYFAEKDAKKREKLYDELCKDIGEQIPSTFWEKADAWRYVAMLFNPTTHIRNVAGNIFNKFVIMADHAVEGALQPILVKRENRTRTWRIANKKTADFAKNDWELMRDVLTSGEGKYNNMMSDIDKNRRILRPAKQSSTRLFDNTAKTELFSWNSGLTDDIGDGIIDKGKQFDNEVNGLGQEDGLQQGSGDRGSDKGTYSGDDGRGVQRVSETSNSRTEKNKFGNIYERSGKVQGYLKEYGISGRNNGDKNVESGKYVHAKKFIDNFSRAGFDVVNIGDSVYAYKKYTNDISGKHFEYLDNFDKIARTLGI